MTNKKPLDYRRPTIIHEFPEGEIVQDMTLFTKRRWYWPLRKVGILYVVTNNGLYTMEIR